MKRREFIAIATGVATWPFRASARDLPVVGLNANPKTAVNMLADVRRGFAESDYVEGRDFQFEYRWADWGPDRLDQLTANAIDLVHRGATALITTTTPELLAAKAATKSIPIVFWIGMDPVEAGIVDSFNRPGSNRTGCYNLNTDVIGKRLEVLRELLPAVKSIAYFVNPASANYAEVEHKALQSAADLLGIRLLVMNVVTPNDIEGVFEMVSRERAGAALIGGDALFFGQRDKLAALAAAKAIPAIFASREYVVAGGLASFGGRYSDGFRLVGNYAGRILKGEKPSDLPVQQITTTELVINLRAAKSLHLTIPTTLLARADEVIE